MEKPERWIGTNSICAGDTIKFVERVFTEAKNGKYLGERTVIAIVLKESYGAEKQQHTFTLKVISVDESGLKTPHPNSKVKYLSGVDQIRRKGRTIYGISVERLRWSDEENRTKVLEEKHDRGNLAREAKKERLEKDGIFGF